jgi:Divergent InlB B-repeat domain
MHTRSYRTTRTRGSLAAIASMAIALSLALPAVASPMQTLTVEKVGTGTGTVTSSPAGISCGATCSAGFAEGTTVTLTGVAGANTAPAQWSGCDSVNGENKCEVTMSAAKAVTTSFNLVQHHLTISKGGTGTGTVTSSPAGIECGATCSVNFVHGTTVTLTGVAGLNTQAAVQWSGCDSVNGEGKCVVAMTFARSVTATFNLTQHQLSVAKAGKGTGTVTSSPAGIECGSACAADFDHNSTVTLTGIRGLHSLPPVWSGCDSVNIEGKCLVTMSAAKAVTATFNLEPVYASYPLTVAKSGTGSGTVAGNGIECGATCSAELLTGTEVELTPIPAEGSVFKRWYGGGCSYEALCKTTIAAKAKKVRAVFTAVGNRTLVVKAAGTGAGTVVSKPQGTGVQCNATCSYQPPVGTPYTLIATPAAGSTFSGWSGACSGTKAACRVKMSEARSVTATFVKTSGPSSSGALKVAAKAKVKGGRALLRIRCRSASSCRGSLKLTAKLGGKKSTIGAATFGLAPGSSETLKVTLTSAAKQLLAATGKLKAKVSGAGIGAHAVRLLPQAK